LICFLIRTKEQPRYPEKPRHSTAVLLHWRCSAGVSPRASIGKGRGDAITVLSRVPAALGFPCVFAAAATMVATKKAKKTHESINNRLALVMKSGKYTLGYKTVLRTLRSSKGLRFLPAGLF
ncbi:hypothetical protein Taro_001612, partial [Colocasia esculenta]|nr:hypothetical protein [Colocasia esculenta]